MAYLHLSHDYLTVLDAHSNVKLPLHINGKTGHVFFMILYYWSFQGDTSVVILFVLCFESNLCAV